MTDTITLPRSVVEQAVKQIGLHCRFHENGCVYLDDVLSSLRAALEQPQGEQEPVAWQGRDGYLYHFIEEPKPGDRPLYTHPQPPRQPLTDKVRSLIGSMVSELRAHRYCGDCYPENGWPEVNSVLAEYAAFKRAHGIGGEA